MPRTKTMRKKARKKAWLGIWSDKTMQVFWKRHHVMLKSSEYDYVDVVVAPDGRLKFKFQDERWRTPEESIRVLEEMKDVFKQIPKNCD